MKEQMIIEVILENNQWKSGITQMKNDVSNINKNIGNTVSSSINNSTKASLTTTNKINQALNGVRDKIKDIRGMDIFDAVGIAASFGVMNRGFKGMEATIERMKGKAQSNLLDVVKEIIGALQIQGMSLEGDDLEWFKKIQGVELKIGDAKSLKDIKNIKKEMAALGLPTKGVSLGFKGVASAIGSVAAAVAAAIPAVIALAGAFTVVAGVVAAFKVSKLGDEIYHNAQRFGMSSDAFQEWSYIMEQTGGTIEDLTGFMETLASEQAAVIDGSEEAAKKFKKLGLSAEEVVGMRQQELFEETVRRIQQIGDATERSAAAYSLFGDEASKFMNVLNMSNGEIDKAIQNYHLLGGAMSGDLVQKSNSLQSSIHNMKQAWQGVSNALAEVFIPIVQVVVRWLTKAFVTINLFIRSLFGLDLKGKTGGAMDSAASSTDKYAASTKKATKAAEELKRTTMGFDELNIVSNPQSGAADSSSADVGGGMGGLGDMGAGLLDASSLNLEGLYAWFEKYKTLIRDVIAWSFLIIGVIGGVIMLCSGNILGAIPFFAMAGIGLAVGSGEGGTWDKFLTQHKGLADALKVVWEVFKDVMVGVWTIIWENVKFCAKTIYDAFLWAWEVVKAITVPIIDFFKAIWHTIEAIFAVVEAVFTGNWSKAWEAVKKAFSSWGTFFKSLWDGLVSIFSATVDFFAKLFKNAWSAIKNVFAGWGDFFKGLWNTIKSIFGNIATSIGNTIVAIVKGAINGIFKMIEDKINFFVDALNGAIGLINKIPGVNLSKLSRFKIPRLAEGGIATSSTIANIGEAGKEAILPLENNTEWMDTLASKIAERNAGPSKIVLQVGEKELGWAAINGINGITKQTGNIQLAL